MSCLCGDPGLTHCWIFVTLPSDWHILKNACTLQCVTVVAVPRVRTALHWLQWLKWSQFYSHALPHICMNIAILCLTNPYVKHTITHPRDVSFKLINSSISLKEVIWLMHRLFDTPYVTKCVAKWEFNNELFWKSHFGLKGEETHQNTKKEKTVETPKTLHSCYAIIYIYFSIKIANNSTEFLPMNT